MSGRKVKLLLVHCFPLLASLKSPNTVGSGNSALLLLPGQSGEYTVLS